MAMEICRCVLRHIILWIQSVKALNVGFGGSINRPLGGVWVCGFYAFCYIKCYRRDKIVKHGEMYYRRDKGNQNLVIVNCQLKRHPVKKSCLRPLVSFFFPTLSYGN